MGTQNPEQITEVKEEARTPIGCSPGGGAVEDRCIGSYMEATVRAKETKMELDSTAVADDRERATERWEGRMKSDARPLGMQCYFKSICKAFCLLQKITNG